MEIATGADCHDGKSVVEAKATTELGITPISAVPTLPKLRTEAREPQQRERTPNTVNNQSRQELLRDNSVRANMDAQTAQAIIEGVSAGGQMLFSYLMYKLAKKAQDSKHHCSCSEEKDDEGEEGAGDKDKKKKEKNQHEQVRQKKRVEYDPSVA